MLPSLAEARTLLAEAEARNPGPWVKHSENVALAARVIAEAHPGLEPERVYILGLLHDIGRREGVTGMRHTLDGYHYLRAKGFEDAARICLTHSFALKDIRAIFGTWDCSAQEFAFVKAYLNDVRYTDEDRLIQLCDCLALPEGICLLEKSMIDVALGYGTNRFTVAKWRAYVVIQEEFEDVLDCSIYRLLPGVIETTFGYRP